jgi:hypothetical protein
MKAGKIATRFGLPVVITVVILYFFFRDISLSDIQGAFLRIPLTSILLFLLLSVSGTFLRAFKYHILLAKKLSFTDIFLITLVRNFSVDLLPARTASLVFYSYLTKRKGISLEEGASSFVVSVFYDTLALSVMLGGLVFFLKTEFNPTFIYIGMALIFAVSVVMIFCAEWVIALLLKIKILHRFSRLVGVLQKIAAYLGEHRKGRERTVVFVLSLLIRLIKYVSVFVLFVGMVPVPVNMQYFSLFCFGLAGTELSSVLPIQGAGGFGTWELAFTLVFKSLQFPMANIKLTGLLIHIITQAWEYLIGITAFLYMMLQGGAPKGEPETGNTVD